MTTDKKTLSEYEGLPCHHWAEELPLIRTVLETLRPKLVIETGTMYGGFAAFLADTITAWDGMVVTIDHLIYPGLQDALRGRTNINFICADVMGDFVDALLYDLVQDLKPQDQSLFYADGPVGRPEFFKLAEIADIVGLHDYGTEVSPEQALEWEQMHSRSPYMHRAFAELQAEKGGYFVSRFWVR